MLEPPPVSCALAGADKVKVAIIREEGSNGDREMASAVYAAGMEPWDVHMSDLLGGKVSLDAFQGIVFVGGFRWVGGWELGLGRQGGTQGLGKVEQVSQVATASWPRAGRPSWCSPAAASPDRFNIQFRPGCASCHALPAAMPT